jgi:hypothetical protein
MRPLRTAAEAEVLPEHLPEELEAYLGVSHRIGEWSEW